MRADRKLSRARQASREIRAARPGPVDGKLRHCRHCLGDNCPGDCLLADGQCIHGWNGKRPGGASWQLLLTRRFWHRVLWGRP